MQHAFCGRAIRHLSLPRALVLGCVLILCGSTAWGQLTSQDPYAPGVPGAPDTGRGIGLSLPGHAKSREADLSLNDEEAPPEDTPFTLNEPMVEVKVEGNTTIPVTEIARHIKTRPGRSVTQKQIKDDVDALVRTRWFASVEPSIRQTNEGNILVFRVLERPIVKKVEYRGNKKLKTKTFEAMTQLKPGSPYDVSANRECARRIQEHYKEKGFPFATVELERGDVRNDPDREVIFVINEGPKCKVTSVKFEGNETFSDPLLKTKTRTKTRILWFFGGKYDQASVNDDVEGVRLYYHSLGYFDVRITPHQKFSDDKATVEMHYEIEEGVRYRINEISIIGNKVLSDEEVQAMVKVKPGDDYNERHITKDIETIREKYGTQGRLFAQVMPIRRWAEEPGILDLVIKIDEDKVYRVRNINIHIAGDYPHTKIPLVKNLSPVQPGDLADPKKIQQMKGKLAGSQYFEADHAKGPRIETHPVKDRNWIKGPDLEIARGQSNSPRPSATTALSMANATNGNRGQSNSPPQSASTSNDFPFGQSALAGYSIFSSDPQFQKSAPVKSARVAKPPQTPAVKVDDPDARPGEVPYHVELAPELANPVVDENEKFLPITPIFRGQSKDPLKPPANYIYDVSPQGDPFGKAIENPDPFDWERMPPPEFIDIDTYLSEARTGRLMFGVGVNSNSGLVGNIVLSEQNFDIMKPPTSWDDLMNGTAWRGNGEKFRIEAMPGTQLSRYLVDWTNPYFMDTNNSLGVSGFFFNRYYLNWTEQRLGGRIRVGRQLDQRWTASASLRLENVDVFNPSVPNPPPLLTEALGSSLLSTVLGTIAHDTRDAAFMPSKGHHAEVTVEQAFGQYSYSRVDAEARQFFTLYQRADGGGKHILSMRGEVAWTGSDTPIFERFFAGGFQSFRGFYFRGVSPIQNGVYIGGDFMVLGSLEYSLPVLANEMVRAVTFTDFGTVNNSVSLGDFRVSVGAGLRVTVPMMGPTPIALDWAIPVMRDPNDKTQLFSFYIGMNR